MEYLVWWLAWSLFASIFLESLAPTLGLSNTDEENDDETSCPVRCRCHGKLVNCSHLGLSHFIHAPAYVTHLILDNNNIDTVSDTALKGMRNLRSLSLRHNNISSITSGAFQYSTQLESLHLDANSLTNLPEDVFDNNALLRKLSLADNAISMDGLNASLYRLRNLHELDLKANVINDDLPVGFSSLRQLRALDLGANDGIINLTDTFFDSLRPLPNLEYIGLGYCPLVHVQESAFANLHSLKRLDLSFTMITSDSVKAAFTGLSNSSIEVIHLTYVLMFDESSITSSMFEYLRDSSLKTLNFKGSYGGFPKGIPSNLFRGLKHLKELYLDDCRIRTISKTAFKGLPRLKTLNLQGNMLDSVTGCSFINSGPTLKTLLTLNLADNMISGGVKDIRFTKNVFPKLEILLLQNNRLSILEIGMFEELSALRSLDLSNNPLTAIVPNVFQDLHSLRTLIVTGSLYLNTLYNGTFRGLRSLKNLVLNNNAIRTVQKTAFRGLRRLEVLRINGNKLGSNSVPFRSPTEARALLVLDLSNNNIEYLGIDMLLQHPRLEQLLVRYNRISHLDGEQLMSLRFLKHIDLSHNSIVEINGDTFESLASLRTLNVAGNPFLCTCLLKDFLDWMESTDVIILEKDSQKCASPPATRGRPVQFFRPSPWECRVKVVLIPILSVCGSITIAMVICVLYCKIMLNRKDALDDDPGDMNEDLRPLQNCTWIRELLPVDRPDVSGSSDEGDVEEPLISESPNNEISK